MAKVSEAFGGSHLKAEHLNGKTRLVQVDGVNIEQVYGEEAYVVYFAGEPRGLKLSATCARDIAQVHGDDMEGWCGRSVELYSEQRTITDRETQIEKQITMIRARAPAGSSVTKLPTPTSGTPPRRPPFDDDIPF